MNGMGTYQQRMQLKARQRIVEAVAVLKAQGLTLTLAKVARQANVCTHTVKKCLAEIGITLEHSIGGRPRTIPAAREILPELAPEPVLLPAQVRERRDPRRDLLHADEMKLFYQIIKRRGI